MASKKIEGVIEEIIDQYTTADSTKRPWIIGFSGGKDSTVLLTLVWIALQRIKDMSSLFSPLDRTVYVVCNDTMVENPIISGYIEDVLILIRQEAKDQGLPIIVKKTTPKLEDTYWRKVIGRGYTVPSNKFRWCTGTLKIKPTSDFLHEQIDEKGEAIVLLGTRYDESVSRGRAMKKREIHGERLNKHNTSANTYVYAPIRTLMLEEVWYVINTFKSPWKFDNSILFQIYSDASADDYECPTVIVNKEHSSCGQSRFGCWTCTVVSKDKSMTALIESGQHWMKPLLDFRDRLVANRNLGKNRSPTRRDGVKFVSDEGRNLGNYTNKYRAEILEDLLIVQKQVQKERPHIILITNQELIAIQVDWNRDLEFNYKVGDIYKKIYNKEISTNNIKSLSKSELRILKDVCKEDSSYYTLIDDLITLQEIKTLMLSKHGLHNDIENRIEAFANENEIEVFANEN